MMTTRTHSDHSVCAPCLGTTNTGKVHPSLIYLFLITHTMQKKTFLVVMALLLLPQCSLVTIKPPSKAEVRQAALAKSDPATSPVVGKAPLTDDEINQWLKQQLKLFQP
jgi:hypothetical protein